MTLVLGAGGPRRSTDEIANGLVRRHGLDGLSRLSSAALREEKGLGDITADRICAVFELGRRVYGRTFEERPRMNGPEQVYRRLKHLMRARREHLVGLYLDAQNGLLHQETISIGSLNTTRSHPREILYPAVTHLALGFILAHNHPSGCLDPSTEDLEFTRFVKRAAEMMGIELYDHLIIAKGGYTSLKERGLF
jgi:DNA repair protein RadC